MTTFSCPEAISIASTGTLIIGQQPVINWFFFISVPVIALFITGSYENI